VTEESLPEIPEHPLGDGAVRDGIGEEDHPIPLWFNVGFYGLIAFGIAYAVFYTTSGWSSRGEYEAQVAEAEARAALARAEQPAQTRNPFRGEAAAIAEGAQVFATICATCHKPDGSGMIGPSLVDPYWKYGNSDEVLYSSVFDGRPAGGMPGWGPQLGSDKVWKALAYLETLPRSDRPGMGAPGYEAASTGPPGS
jgi:cytochrome c oxidase cbb3-type subunit 3